jgi:hypothetical protein
LTIPEAIALEMALREELRAATAAGDLNHLRLLREEATLYAAQGKGRRHPMLAVLGRALPQPSLRS